MNLTEDQLCEIFADKVVDSPDFAAWLIRKTRFSALASTSRVLDKEQMAIRPRKRWWRHWWCHVPELDKHRETDIFIVFECLESKFRFAFHIENKRDNYKLNDGQAAAYGPRARHMLGKTDYLSYADYATILVAPKSFKARHEAEADLFDEFISYEDVSQFLPEFASAGN